MLEHHIQLEIVHRLAFADHLKFTELKPDELDNKLFTYHLQKVVKAGYVQKSLNGEYSLTTQGRQLGTRAYDKQLNRVIPPESVLFLVVRRPEDQAWLLYRRKVHPLREQVGFMHCRPDAKQSVAQTAAEECQRKTGLSGEFTALGGGYARIFEANGDPESFTQFTLLYCDEATGELQQHDEYGEYFWVDELDFKKYDFFPTTKTLLEHYTAKQPFFSEFNFTFPD